MALIASNIDAVSGLPCQQANQRQEHGGTSSGSKRDDLSRRLEALSPSRIVYIFAYIVPISPSFAKAKGKEASPSYLSLSVSLLPCVSLALSCP